MMFKITNKPASQFLANRFSWFTFLLTSVVPGLMAAPAPEDPLIRIQYDYELAAYCGLTSPTVTSGFKRELADMLEEHNISREAVLKARSKATVAVYREWQNRALGGFKGWCRNEGAAAVQRFTPVAK